MKITEHFDSSEFDQHATHGFTEVTPYPDEWIESRLRPLCEALEVIRSACGGRPMTVLSGYRSVAYNEAVYAAKGKPATNSQHSLGRAADIRVGGMDAEGVHAIVLSLLAEGAIKVYGLGIYRHDNFVHVDIREGTGGHVARWDGDADGGVKA